MKRITLLVLLISFLTTMSTPLRAEDTSIPQPASQFYVLDQADILDQNTEQTIIQTSVDLQQKTKAQIVVVTINSLNGRAPEDYALAILRGWGIGDKTLNNGLLLLVSKDDRISRIEVGYGLEGALPDAKTGQIQDEYMIPYFRINDYNKGILNGYIALAQEVAKEYQVTLEIGSPQTLPVLPSTVAAYHLPVWAIFIIVVLVILLLYLDQRFLNGFLLGLILGMLFRGRGGGGGFGGGGGGGFGGGGGSTRRW